MQPLIDDEIRRLKVIRDKWSTTKAKEHGSYSFYLKIEEFLKTLFTNFPIASKGISEQSSAIIRLRDASLVEHLKFKRKDDEARYQEYIYTAVKGIERLIYNLEELKLKNE